jgi:hypothetical protein
MDGEILAIHLLGFLMEVQEGRIGPRRLIHSFVHLERKRRAMEMGMEALDEGFKGASFHGGL